MSDTPAEAIVDPNAGAPVGAPADSGTPPSPSGGEGVPPSPPAGEVANPPAGGDKTVGTLIGGEAADPAKDPAKPEGFQWPENWRDEASRGDAKVKAELERYGSVEDIAKALVETKARLRAGGAKTALKDGASPEEVAAWRKDNGIPETPEGYEIKVEGLVFGDADKPLVDSFKAHAHGKNWNPDQFNQALEWWHGQQQAAAEQRFEADTAFKAATEAALREEWGPAFKPKINGIENLLAQTGLGPEFLNGRMADGSVIGNHAGLMRALDKLAQEVSPTASVIPAGTTSTPQSIAARKAEIQTMMREAPQKYYADAAVQKEYGDLLVAEEKMAARG